MLKSSKCFAQQLQTDPFPNARVRSVYNSCTDEVGASKLQHLKVPWGRRCPDFLNSPLLGLIVSHQFEPFGFSTVILETS